MQKRNSIVNIPLVGGIVLSVAVHAAALYSRGGYKPAEPMLDAGRTVVQLTLMPSLAIEAKDPPTEPAPEPVVEPAPEIVAEPVPIPVPVPEPVVEPAAEPDQMPLAEPTPELAAEEAAEQIASMIEDKGVVTEAAPVVGIRATYPRSSQRRGHQGTVVLSIQVLKNGRSGSVEIISSSGFPRLDEAAVKAAKAARYRPAEQFGNPVESRLIQPVTFELTQ